MTERPDIQKAPNPISDEYEGYYNRKLRKIIASTLVNNNNPLAQKTRDDIGRIVGGKCGLLEISGAVVSQLVKAGVLRPFVTVFVPTAVITDYVVALDSKIPPSSHPQTRLELRAAGDGLQRDLTCWVLERRKIEFNQ